MRLKRPKRSISAPLPKRLPTREKSVKSFALMPRLARFPSKTDTLRQSLDGQKGSLHVEPSSTSDKRDDVLPARYVLAVSRLSSCVLALWPRLFRRVPGGVVFRKLSKLPNRENA